MRKILLVLTAATIMAGTAVAGEPLTDHQMDGVTAGFEVFSGPTPGEPQVLQALAPTVTSTATPTPTPAPTPAPTSTVSGPPCECNPGAAYDPPDPAALAPLVAAAQAAAPPPPPTPTQQFSTLLSTNGIGLR